MPERFEPAITLGRFARFLVRGGRVFLEDLLVDIFGSFRCGGTRPPAPPKPRGGALAGGAGPEEGYGLHLLDDSDTLFRAEVQSFLPTNVNISRAYKKQSIALHFFGVC